MCTVHATPVLKTTEDDVPVMAIPDEKGYFPVASLESRTLSLGPNTKIHQLLKKSHEYRRRSTQHTEGTLLCCGTMLISDPVDGTPDAVMIVGTCDETCFYVTNDDATVKVSPTEFVVLLPEDCLSINFDSEFTSDDEILLFEGTLAARTKFHDDSEGVAEATMRRSLVPDGKMSQSVYTSAVWMADQLVTASHHGSQYISSMGERQRQSTERAEKPIKVSAAARNSAKAIRGVAKASYKIVSAVTDTVSNVVGGAIAKTLVPPPDRDGKPGKSDSALKSSLLTATLAFSEVSEGVDLGYEKMVRSAKDEATSFVAHKYGHEAAELARHTTGATANFGRAALTARRIISVKTIAKSSAKVALRQSITNLKK
jgi:hypothetical protein